MIRGDPAKSKNVSNISANNKGLGMYRIVKTLGLNNAEIDTILNSSKYHKVINETAYEHNTFKKIFYGQQDRFAIE